MLTAKMIDNKYAEHAKELRKKVWEIIFSKIDCLNKQQPIPEHSLNGNRDNNPLIRALMGIYYLISDKINTASSN